MSCRHDLANGTCFRCYPNTGTIEPGPEDEYEDNLEGIGAMVGQPQNPGYHHGGVMVGMGTIVYPQTPKKETVMDNKYKKKGFHHLKCWTKYFDAIIAGIMTCTLRANDREFQVGDQVELEEWNPGGGEGYFRVAEGYTGRSCTLEITHILSGVEVAQHWPGALGKEMVILSFKRLL